MKGFSINPNSCKKSAYKFTSNFGPKKEESNNKFRSLGKDTRTTVMIRNLSIK